MRYNSLLGAVAVSCVCTLLQLDPTWVLRVKDGDTFVLRNAGITNVEVVRVCCVDTPEKKDPGFDDATVFTDRWIHTGPFTLEVCKRDSFGRLLGTVTRDGHDLATDLLDAGLAVPYKRGKELTPSSSIGHIPTSPPRGDSDALSDRR